MEHLSKDPWRINQRLWREKTVVVRRACPWLIAFVGSRNLMAFQQGSCDPKVSALERKGRAQNSGMMVSELEGISLR